MQIHAGWEFGTLHFRLPNPQIIISFSTWEYKNKSHGGESILLVARCRDSNQNRRIRTFKIVGKSRNDGKSRFDNELDILLYQNEAEKIS